MPVTGRLKMTLDLSGDVQQLTTLPSVANTASPGADQPVNLAQGNNTIAVSTAIGVPQYCIIVPPAGNTTAIVVKGVNGDTGIRIHNTQPTPLALDPSVTSFVLNAAAAIAGVRLYWV